MATKTTKQLQRSFPSTMKQIQNLDLEKQRQALKQQLAPLGRAHSTAEALLAQLDSLAHSDLQSLASIDDPSGVKALKSLTGALKDVASTMALLRQEVREHVGAAMSVQGQEDAESPDQNDV
jgi:hypothetical protein